MKTNSISTKWVVEIYPFESPIPTAGDFIKTPAPLKISVIGSKTAAASVKSLISSKFGIPPNANFEGAGVTGVSISRAKDTPDGQCSISVVGPLPASMIPGSWVVVSTISSGKDGSPKYLMRFFGQIYAIDVNYAVDDRGLKTTNSQVKVREWSYAYRVPVKYDIISIQASLSNSAFTQAAALKTFGATGGVNPQEELTKLLADAYSPYEMAHIVLKLIGTINSTDILPEAAKSPGIEFPDLAVNMPSIPPSVLERVGQTNADPKNPFKSGLVKVITGLLQKGVYNTGDWDGIWKSVKIDGVAKDMQSAARNLSVSPKVQGLAAMIQQGIPAWDILTQLCESSLNEVFTDIWYEESEVEMSGKKVSAVVGRPVLVVRDKPFLIKALRDNQPAELKNTPSLREFTLYDNLPRINIPNEQIKSFRINNNVVNSPNYIRAEYTDLGGDRLSGTKAALAGTVRLANEMDRFGGNYETVKTSFLGLNVQRDSNTSRVSPNVTSNSFETYFGTLKGLFTLWHAYDYRMGQGVLMIKDDNLPVSIGVNVQFKFGNHTLVAHVEQVEYKYEILNNGLEETTTFITVRRICKVEEDGSIGFVAPGDFGNLLYAEPKPGTDFGGRNTFTNLLGKFAGGTSFNPKLS